MKPSIVLGIGTDSCGTASLARILRQQPDVQCSCEEQPLLPWKVADPKRVLTERFARFRRHGTGGILADVAHFYLPYLEDVIALEPNVRIVCLKRAREEVVASFCERLDRTMPLPINHWAREPAAGWHHDPQWTRTFPAGAPDF